MTALAEFIASLEAPVQPEVKADGQVQGNTALAEFIASLESPAQPSQPVAEPSAIDVQPSPGGITPEILERAGVRTFDQTIPGQVAGEPDPDIKPHSLQPDITQPVGLDGEGFDFIGTVDATGNVGRGVNRGDSQANPGFGDREDGTQKGMGFYGKVNIPGMGPTFATELSVTIGFDGKEVLIPTLIPGLTEQEFNTILSLGKEIPPGLMDKIADHAVGRIKNGRSPFAEEGEEGAYEIPITGQQVKPKTFGEVSPGGTPFIAPDGGGNLDRISRSVAGNFADTTSKFKESFAKAVDSLPEEFLPQKALVGAVETFAEFTTGFLASIPGGLGGLVELARTGNIEKAIDTIDEITKSMTIEVQTKMGKDIKHMADIPFEKYNEFVDTLVDSGDLVGGFTPEEQPLANALMSAVLKGPGLLLLLGGTPKAVKTIRSASKTKPVVKSPFEGRGADPDPIRVPVTREESEIRNRLPEELDQINVIADKPIEEPVAKEPVVSRETPEPVFELPEVEPAPVDVKAVEKLKVEEVLPDTRVEAETVAPKLEKTTSAPLTDKELLADHKAEMADTAKPDGIDEALIKSAEIREDIKKKGGGTTLYSGLPSDLIGSFIKKANEGLRSALKKGAKAFDDSLGKPIEGVNVKSKKTVSGLGVLKNVRSPSYLAKEFPALESYVKDGIHAEDSANAYAETFKRRLNAASRKLRGGAKTPLQKLAPENRKIYRENEKVLNDIMVQGDLMGKEFTLTELKAMGAGPEVVKAYRINRSLFKKALQIGNKSRVATGQDPVKPLPGYVSHVFHDFFILADKKVVGSARTLNSAVKAGNELKRAGAKQVDILPKEFELLNEAEQAIQIGDMEYFEMKKRLETDFNLTLEEANEITEGLARRTSRKKFFGHFMERKGVPGWEKNLNVINQHYFLKIARVAAVNEFKHRAITRFEREHGKFGNEHKDTVARYKKQYINDVSGMPTQLEQFFNESFESIANTEFAKLTGMKHIRDNYFGDRPMAQIMQAEGTAVAVAKLGFFNVSAATINATQILNTNAILGPKYTARGIEAFHLKSPQTLKLLQNMGVKRHMGLEAGDILTDSPVGKAAKASLVLFSEVELWNRGVAGLGAYAKAIEGKVKGIPKGDRTLALEYAEEVINKTQFNYSVADAPNIFRRVAGSPLATLLRFQKFTIKEMEFITSLKGAENPRFWIPFMAFTGYYGFPGSSALDKMVKGLFGFSPINETDRALVEWAGDDPAKQAVSRTVRGGLVAGVAKVDISKRVGQGNIVPTTPSDFRGASINTVTNLRNSLANRQWVQALGDVTPAPANFIRMFTNDTALTSPHDRDRKIVDLNLPERVALGFGFQPMKKSDAQMFQRITASDREIRREKIVEAIDDYIEARENKDEEGKAKARAVLKELRVSMKSVRIESRKKKSPKVERIYRGLSRKERRENRALYGGLTNQR
jgi:hypothetical protein